MMEHNIRVMFQTLAKEISAKSFLFIICKTPHNPCMLSYHLPYPASYEYAHIMLRRIISVCSSIQNGCSKDHLSESERRYRKSVRYEHQKTWFFRKRVSILKLF